MVANREWGGGEEENLNRTKTHPSSQKAKKTEGGGSLAKWQRGMHEQGQGAMEKTFIAPAEGGNGQKRTKKQPFGWVGSFCGDVGGGDKIIDGPLGGDDTIQGAVARPDGAREKNQRRKEEERRRKKGLATRIPALNEEARRGVSKTRARNGTVQWLKKRGDGMVKTISGVWKKHPRPSFHEGIQVERIKYGPTRKIVIVPTRHRCIRMWAAEAVNGGKGTKPEKIPAGRVEVAPCETPSETSEKRVTNGGKKNVELGNKKSGNPMEAGRRQRGGGLESY